MRFGVFHAPYHLPMGQNPNLALHRDVEFIKHLDRLGFDEAWVGEHHSCGSELISDPALFLAHVAPQTSNIKLGTGVLSLPYHNPLWVADRIILLDHLTRGRIMLGLGPGALTTDAYMIGLDPLEQRNALEEDVDVLKRLLDGETVSIKTTRYELVEARTQMRPYSNFEIGVAAVASPTGPRIAGKYGAGMLSIGATMSALTPDGVDTLGIHWDVYEQRAQQFGQTADRSSWRLVGPMHISETREQARKDVEHGIDAWFDYFQDVQAAVHFEVAGKTTEERINFVVDSGLGVIGTPEDAIQQIRTLQEQSKGGFGAYMIMTHEWANWSSTLHSFELFAERVAPVFQGQLESLQRSADWAATERGRLGGAQVKSVENAIERHRRETESVSS
ncbi:LLM class flavin-dependent oxidoreductase [Rhodococcus oxybenzonivorans]|uniref:LLM class flavin-dependent oxidoreductase n=1 Tax=Rhodococcus oxybenzonivorans TaxID=1990687 RepID=UPI002952C92E|nr:LLM class flavin-dependent oxidoreductase [Rhodococcus oxybenzonivorans]MDV7353661.1 LLM class flavin-dependent oxidoreductase [Rhodococcus oxybenzonivorans]